MYARNGPCLVKFRRSKIGSSKEIVGKSKYMEINQGFLWDKEWR